MSLVLFVELEASTSHTCIIDHQVCMHSINNYRRLQNLPLITWEPHTGLLTSFLIGSYHVHMFMKRDQFENGGPQTYMRLPFLYNHSDWFNDWQIILTNQQVVLIGLDSDQTSVQTNQGWNSWNAVQIHSEILQK